MQKYNKAIIAFVTSTLGMLGLFGVAVPETVTAENITAVITSATTFIATMTALVWRVPNKD